MIAQDPTIDYSQLGYSNRLTADDSLSARNSGKIVDNNQVESNYQDASVGNSKISTVSANKISAGTMVVSMNIGGANITIDGSAQQILVNDGTTNRILIGYGSGLF